MEESTIDSEEKQRGVPEEIALHDIVFDIEFHPTHDIVALGMITGEMKCYKYSNEESNVLLHEWAFHKKACRAVQFALGGSVLLSGSSDCSLRAVDLNTGKLGYTYAKAHNAPINTILTHLDNMLVTGDDDGCIKLWDLRKQTCCFEWNEHEDFISGLASSPDKNTCLATGGDGYLSILHLRKGTLEAMSDQMEDELLSVAVVKNGSKVAVGTQEGIIAIWSWGDWGDMSDRFVGHPNSVDTIVVLDEDTIATGSSDGIIRVCGIHPNKFIGAIGEHGEFPVERIKLSKDKRLLASCSHDNTVKFWSWDPEDVKEEQQQEEEGMQDQQQQSEEPMEMEQEAPKKVNKNFFSDLL